MNSCAPVEIVFPSIQRAHDDEHRVLSRKEMVDLQSMIDE